LQSFSRKFRLSNTCYIVQPVTRTLQSSTHIILVDNLKQFKLTNYVLANSNKPIIWFCPAVDDASVVTFRLVISS